MDLDSLILERVLVNGGKPNSIEVTSLTESEFLTEETAAETDLQEQMCLLITKSVDKYRVVQETVNGTQSNAPDLCMVERLDL